MENQYLSIITISLLFSTFFSGMEIAFTSSNRLKIELDKKHRIYSSDIISFFTSNPTHFITTMLVGNSISLVIFGIIISKLLETFLKFNLAIYSETILIIITIIIASVIILITREFIPKAIFRNRPNTFLKIFALPVLILYIILFPFTLIIIWITNFILRYIFKVRGGLKKENNDPVFGKMELNHMMIETQNGHNNNEEGEQELKIFQNVLEFSKLKVRDCMVPRTEITAIEFKSTVNELINKFIETGYSKIPIYAGTIDNIIGYVNSKELYKGSETIKSRLVPLSVVPESMPVNKLFHNLIKDRKSMVIVVDEYGGTSGIITLEDIMEEIFGEIEDEHDTTEFIENQINENEFILSGRLEIDYLNEKYNLKFPESNEYDTLAGFIISNYGDIPKINTNIKIGIYEMKILKVSPIRIELVHLTLHSTEK